MENTEPSELDKLLKERAANNKNWWDKAKEIFKRDNKDGVVDENDPEYDAQKIYHHWLKSFK